MSNEPTRANGLIARLAALPLWGVFLLVLAIFLGGLFTTGIVSFVLLGAVVVLMLTLARIQWHVLPAQQRVVRTIAILGVSALAVVKLFGAL